MLTGSLPPQLTVTAGTEATPRRRGTMATMSSACSGWYTLGALTWTGTAWPDSIMWRWMAGHPPLSP